MTSSSMEHKFKIGDKVKVVKYLDGELPRGIGEVVYIGVDYTTIKFPEWYYEANDLTCFVLVEEAEEKKLTLNRLQVIDLCRTFVEVGAKIHAIRYWRMLTGCGIVEAKNFIENDCSST